uniref:Single stranded DNA binding protein n=1 Tax=Podoviridae sp. ctjUd6 TaxID=2825270 RepID=A0A8S5U2P9_9CAUD|nr:MAG TPA: Single stranded DNA binding protein [Podoviridae sp. ctjUd6]DAJ36587.1 MAG TPA: Single stranded DNA binding protein [Caudoviricetes sp.]
MTETAIATVDAELVADADIIPAGSLQSALDSIHALANPQTGVATSIELTPMNAVKLYQVNSDAEPLEANVGTVINLRHYVATVVQFQAETRPGHFETRTGVRLVLVDDVEGKSYATMSEVVMSDLKQLIGLAGHPSTWEEPIRVVAAKVKGRGARSFLTLKIAD